MSGPALSEGGGSGSPRGGVGLCERKTRRGTPAIVLVGCTSAWSITRRVGG